MTLDAAFRGSYSLDDAMGFTPSSSTTPKADAAPETPAATEPKAPTDPEVDLTASRAEFKEKAAPLLTRIDENRTAGENLKPPELKPLPEAPKPMMRDPLQAFGSLASTLAIFGSMLTRQPLTNALNAAAGVMDAWKFQDVTAAKQQFDIWKANVDNAKTLHDWQQSNYDNAIKKLDHDTDGALKEIQILATMYRDDATAELARTKQINELLKLQNSRTASMDDLQRAALLAERMQNYQTWSSEHPNATNEERAEALARFTSSGQYTPEMVYENVIPAIDAGIAGDWSASQAMVGRTAAAKSQFAEFVKRRMDELKIPQDSRGQMLAGAKAIFEGQKAASRSLATLQAKFAAFKGNAESIADEVVRTSRGFERFGNLPMNRVYGRVARELGDTAVTVFDTALNTFAAEYARALQQTGVTTDTLREHVREMFSRELTHGQIMANVAQAKREMQLIGGNFGNVRNLLAKTWGMPSLTFQDEPDDTDVGVEFKSGKAFTAPAPAEQAAQSTRATDPGVVPAEPTGTTVRAEPTGTAEPTPLPLPAGGPNPAVMRDGAPYKLPDGRIGYWDAAAKGFRTKKKAAP